MVFHCTLCYTMSLITDRTKPIFDAFGRKGFSSHVLTTPQATRKTQFLIFLGRGNRSIMMRFRVRDIGPSRRLGWIDHLRLQIIIVLAWIASFPSKQLEQMPHGRRQGSSQCWSEPIDPVVARKTAFDHIWPE
jgi:hypothetical protein